MNKKESITSKDVKKQAYESKKMNTSEKSKSGKGRDLPWWVELLFVQIGLPDKLLIRILKANKKSKELFKNNKNPLLIILFIITTSAYFYPVVKNSKNKLNCEAIAKNYIIKNKNISLINKKELKMLSINFCNGGDEIYKIKN